MKTITTLLFICTVTFYSWAQPVGCSADWNGYVASKDDGISGYFTLTGSGPAMVSQAYHYSGPGVITAVRFDYEHYYWWGYPIRVSVYPIDANNKPTGSPLVQTQTVWLGWGAHTAIIGLDSKAINSDFAVVVERLLINVPIDIKHTDGDGNGEGLASFKTSGGNWESMTSDSDFYIEPRMIHYNKPGFSLNDYCVDVNQPVDFVNTSIFTQDRMFNQITEPGYSGSEMLYSWDFGDGIGVSNDETPTYTYSTAGFYTISLTTTIVDWDGVPCQNTSSVEISVGLDVTATASDLTCNGISDGSLTLNGSGGTGNYEFSLDGFNFETQQTFDNLDAGDYTIFVMDDFGCIVQGSNVTIQEPTEVTISIPIGTTSATCGNSDGGLNIFANGGEGTLSYSIDNVTFQSSGTFTGLPGGVQTVYVKDEANACVYSEDVVIPTTDAPDLSLQSYTTNACYGAANGTITVIGSGGTGSLEYSLDGTNYQSTGTFSGLSAGTYQPHVRDAAGCIGTIDPVAITEPEPVKWSLDSSPTLCNGSSDGSIEVSYVVGGIGTITYSLDGINFQQSPLFQGLPAGVYSITLKDGAGCTSTSSITVTEPSPITPAVIATTDLSCFESHDGSIMVDATGGVGEYDFRLQNWDYQDNGEFYDLQAGTYTVTVRDENNCLATTMVTLSEPSEITTNITSGNSTCGNANGNLLAVASGGSGSGYTYNLNDGMQINTTGSFSGLAAGEYGISVTDDTGCESFVGTVVSDADGPSIDAASSTDVTCFNGSDGSITITGVSGGTGTLEYSIDGEAYQSSNVFTDLTAGNHTVLVRDANGCTGETSITLTQPAQISVVLNGTDVTCFNGTNGEIVVAAGGGSGTLAYSTNGINYQSTPNFSGLSAGTYTITVKDAGQCTSSSQIIITEPAEIIQYYGSVDVTCYGDTDGAIYTYANGGTGSKVYSLDGINYQTNGAFTNLGAGLYSVYTKDANNCIVYTEVLIDQPDAIAMSGNITDVSCANGDDGVIDLTVFGGTPPYSYLWTGGNFFNTEDIINVSGGTYNVTVSDANGCTAMSSFVIEEPANPVILNGTVTNASDATASDGTIDLTVTGGNPPYTYNWDNGATTEDINSLSPGVYLVEVTDASGCSTSTYFTVSFFVGLGETDKGQEIRIYPNPARDIVHVNMIETVNKVDLIDMTGKIVKTFTPGASKFKLEVHEISGGVYFINLNTEGGVIPLRVVLDK